jgi:hypothetical protein
MGNRKNKIQTLTHGYQDFIVPDIFQNANFKFFHDIGYLKTVYYLDDLLSNENSSFNDNQLNLEMGLERLCSMLREQSQF